MLPSADACFLCGETVYYVHCPLSTRWQGEWDIVHQAKAAYHTFSDGSKTPLGLLVDDNGVVTGFTRDPNILTKFLTHDHLTCEAVMHGLAN